MSQVRQNYSSLAQSKYTPKEQDKSKFSPNSQMNSKIVLPMYSAFGNESPPADSRVRSNRRKL